MPAVLVLYKPPDSSRLQYLTSSPSPDLNLPALDGHDSRFQLTIENDQLSYLIDLVSQVNTFHHIVLKM